MQYLKTTCSVSWDEVTPPIYELAQEFPFWLKKDFGSCKLLELQHIYQKSSFLSLFLSSLKPRLSVLDFKLQDQIWNGEPGFKPTSSPVSSNPPSVYILQHY